MLRTVRFSALVLVAWFPGLVPGASQFDRRSVAGTVIDRRGNALRDASVQLENTATLSITSYRTDKDGRFHFTRLRDDIDFTLKAHYRSLWSKPRTISQFDSSKHFEINLVIPTE